MLQDFYLYILKFTGFFIFIFHIISFNSIFCDRSKRSILNDPKYKWNLPIKYRIDSDKYRELIQHSIDNLEKQTCIRFQKTNETEFEGFKFIEGENCVSVVGKSSKLRPQNISISDDCITMGGIQHEIAHSLGILHEMSRRDRDKYIKIFKKNIANYAYTNFVIYDNFKTNSYGIKFNYGSGMLYDRFAGSKNSKPATSAKKKYYSKTMGQIFDLAFTDIKLLNYHYCNQTCEIKLNCENNGYTNPNKCSACKCPNFFTGKLCNEIWPSPPSCGKTKLYATSRYKKLYVYGRKKCLYEIYSQKNKRIKLKIQYASLTRLDPCQRNHGLEIKYLTDKSVSGAMFCGVYKKASITTLSDKVFVYYVGLKKFHRTKIIFKSFSRKKKH